MTMAAEIKKRMAAQPIANRPGGTIQPGVGKSVDAGAKSGCC